MKEEPYKYSTYILEKGTPNKLIPAYIQRYEFDNETKAKFFISQKRKNPDVIKVSEFSLMKGEKGNKKKRFYVSVSTPRNEK